jgi:hypothetical protein
VVDHFEVVDWARVDSSMGVSRDSAFVQTYVYWIPSLSKWYPVPPESVSVAITVAGVPDMTAGVEATGTPALAGILPNPARHSVSILFAQELRNDVKVSIFDAMGRRVAKVPGYRGQTQVRWDLKDPSGIRVPAGVYWLQVDGQGERRRVIALR